mmetsp:Transcript_10455/g.11966  ORF Transcript_10455/g.11966 Transcript_10455/m.11966 type:complete len:213 (-) Transcript_10455:578-1216(-)
MLTVPFLSNNAIPSGRTRACSSNTSCKHPLRTGLLSPWPHLRTNNSSSGSREEGVRTIPPFSLEARTNSCTICRKRSSRPGQGPTPLSNDTINPSSNGTSDHVILKSNFESTSLSSMTSSCLYSSPALSFLFSCMPRLNAKYTLHPYPMLATMSYGVVACNRISLVQRSCSSPTVSDPPAFPPEKGTNTVFTNIPTVSRNCLGLASLATPIA